jgi:chaperonin GroES
MPHYQPTQDRLLVLQDEPPTHYPGTELEMPERERKHHRPNTGTVAEVGPGRRYDDGQVYALAVQKGQKVMFAPTETLTKVEHDGQEHLMMREQDVFLVLSEPAAQATKNKVDVHRQFVALDGQVNSAEGTNLAGLIESYKRAGHKSVSLSSLDESDRKWLLRDNYTIAPLGNTDAVVVSWNTHA